jgi:hypothetical protein
MTPSQRKLALTAHVATSVALLGSIAAFLALAIAALVFEDAQTIHSAYWSMNLIARLVIVPMAIASLVSGLIQSLGTPWGLFRHYWILAKLALTVFAILVLLGKMELIESAAHVAAEVSPAAGLQSMGIELAIHAAGGLLVLLIPTILSIYKPRGMTPYGRRVRRRQLISLDPLIVTAQSVFSDSSRGAGKTSGSSITITLRRSYVFGIVLTIVMVHLFLLHIQAMGFGGH